QRDRRRAFSRARIFSRCALLSVADPIFPFTPDATGGRSGFSEAAESSHQIDGPRREPWPRRDAAQHRPLSRSAGQAFPLSRLGCDLRGGGSRLPPCTRTARAMDRTEPGAAKARRAAGVALGNVAVSAKWLGVECEAGSTLF